MHFSPDVSIYGLLSSILIAIEIQMNSFLRFLHIILMKNIHFHYF